MYCVYSYTAPIINITMLAQRYNSGHNMKAVHPPTSVRDAILAKARSSEVSCPSEKPLNNSTLLDIPRSHDVLQKSPSDASAGSSKEPVNNGICEQRSSSPQHGGQDSNRRSSPEVILTDWEATPQSSGQSVDNGGLSSAVASPRVESGESESSSGLSDHGSPQLCDIEMALPIDECTMDNPGPKNYLIIGQASVPLARSLKDTHEGADQGSPSCLNTAIDSPLKTSSPPLSTRLPPSATVESGRESERASGQNRATVFEEEQTVVPVVHEPTYWKAASFLKTSERKLPADSQRPTGEQEERPFSTTVALQQDVDSKESSVRNFSSHKCDPFRLAGLMMLRMGDDCERALNVQEIVESTKALRPETRMQ